MLYRVAVTFIAVMLFPGTGQCEVAILEMTTAASLGPNGAVRPSSMPISLELLSPSVTTYQQMPNVLYTVVNGNHDTEGLIDLNFNLILGSETLSNIEAHKYDFYSRTSGPGALGATSSLIGQAPMVFSSDKGTLTVNYSKAFCNFLGDPPGTSGTVLLTVGLRFAPAPEPSSCLLLVLGAAIVCFRRRWRR